MPLLSVQHPEGVAVVFVEFRTESILCYEVPVGPIAVVDIELLILIDRPFSGNSEIPLGVVFLQPMEGCFFETTILLRTNIDVEVRPFGYGLRLCQQLLSVDGIPLHLFQFLLSCCLRFLEFLLLIGIVVLLVLRLVKMEFCEAVGILQLLELVLFQRNFISCESVLLHPFQILLPVC